MLKLGTILSCSVLEINLLMLKSDLFVLQMVVLTLLELFVTSGEELKIYKSITIQLGLYLKLLL